MHFKRRRSRSAAAAAARPDERRLLAPVRQVTYAYATICALSFWYSSNPVITERSFSGDDSPNVEQSCFCRRSYLCQDVESSPSSSSSSFAFIALACLQTHGSNDVNKEEQHTRTRLMDWMEAEQYFNRRAHERERSRRAGKGEIYAFCPTGRRNERARSERIDQS